MKALKRLSIIAAVCGLGLTAGLTPATAAVPEAAVALKAGADRGIADGYPGIVGLVRDGSQTQYIQAGVGDRGTRTPADPKAKFRIGSNTKSFTAATVLLLEADGLLSLDDTVAKWLPNAVNANGYDGSKITVRQLLNQTSNLPDYTMNIDGYTVNPNWTPQRLVDGALRKRPPNAQPGQKWEYANTNYVLAGMVIRAVTGNEPAAEMKTRIFDRLGLADTSLPTTDNNIYGNFLHGYYLAGPVMLDMTVTSVQATQTAGAIISTLDDLGTFERALVGGTLLPPAQQAELKTTVPTGIAGSTYGLGLMRVDTSCGRTAWYHNGAVPGYYSFHITSDDGSKQVVEANNENHLVQGTPGQTHTQEGALNAFCAL
ncbi:serine hydrolase domain-containing protein [Streptomyces sp. NPDC059070]|uniref:serine hydrolase domain-containing protein n=1 Tax=Streptomyces sp. NPDC059070 TaxID=3346713 RepID=UPI00367D97DA